MSVKRFVGGLVLSLGLVAHPAWARDPSSLGGSRSTAPKVWSSTSNGYRAPKPGNMPLTSTSRAGSPRPSGRPAYAARNGNGTTAQGEERGHLTERHVGLSPAALADRLQRQPELSHASTFVDQAEANKAQFSVRKQKAPQIADWVRSGAHGTRAFTGTFSGGLVLARGQAEPARGTSARIVLSGDGRGKYIVLTGYPEL